MNKDDKRTFYIWGIFTAIILITRSPLIINIGEAAFLSFFVALAFSFVFGWITKRGRATNEKRIRNIAAMEEKISLWIMLVGIIILVIDTFIEEGGFYISKTHPFIQVIVAIIGIGFLSVLLSGPIGAFIEKYRKK